MKRLNKIIKEGVLVIILLIFPLICFAQESKTLSFYPIHEINQNKLGPGAYITEGFVVKIFTCPPCPKGAQCGPCMPPNIVISEENKLLQAYHLTDKDLIIFVKDTEYRKHFKLGKKYRFVIKILSYKHTSRSINDVELVEYQLIK